VRRLGFNLLRSSLVVSIIGRALLRLELRCFNLLRSSLVVSIRAQRTQLAQFAEFQSPTEFTSRFDAWINHYRDTTTVFQSPTEFTSRFDFRFPSAIRSIKSVSISYGVH